MKSLLFLPLGICLASTGCYAASPAAGTMATPSASKTLLAQAPALPHSGDIARVKAGTLKVANASWWGFDKDDATDCLQNAINSGVPKLIVDNTGSDWIINKPLNLVSNQEIIFADGVVIQAKKDCFHGNNDSLFRGANLTNVTLEGQGKAILRMRKADYQDATRYTKAEWRSGISLTNCSNFTLRHLTITQTGGDGLYLGASANGYNKNVLVEDVNFDANHRQGVSVISVDGFTVRHSRFTNTSGTAPQAGIDFEPNEAGQRLANCVMDDCVFTGNTGGGVDIYAVNLNGATVPISITLNRCYISGNSMGLSSTTTRSTTNAVTGNVTFNDCKFDHNSITLGNPILQSVHYLFKNCTLDFSPSKSESKSVQHNPILLSTDSRIEKPVVGGIAFDHTTIIKDKGQAPITVSFHVGSFDYQTTLSDQITGSLYVKNGHGRPTQFDLPAFIRQTQADMQASDPNILIKQKYSDATVTDITPQWRFLPDAANGENVAAPDFDDSAWKTINGGNWWQRQGFTAYHGIGWYRKTLTLPALTAGQKAELFFDGVDGTAMVYVNGVKVGQHVLAKDYTGWDAAFRFDVTGALKPGRNVIAVQVASKSIDTASGINQPVHLLIGTPR